MVQVLDGPAPIFKTRAAVGQIFIIINANFVLVLQRVIDGPLFLQRVFVLSYTFTL